MICTYNEPVAKTAVVKIFLFRGICSFQTEGIGRMSIAKSLMTLNVVVAKYAAVLSIQCPEVINLFQILSRGMYSKIPAKAEAKYIKKQLQIRMCMAMNMHILPFLLGTKILRYWSRIESLIRNMIGQ